MLVCEKKIFETFRKKIMKFKKRPVKYLFNHEVMIIQVEK